MFDAAPEEWRRGKMLDFFQLQRGFDLPVQSRKPGFVPIIASNGQVGLHDRAPIPAPAVVTGRSGTIGNVTFSEEPCWPLNTTLFVSDFKQSDPLYVYYFLQGFPLKEHASGTGVPTLNRNDVHAVEVCFPPLDEQRRIAEVLQSVDKAITATEQVERQLLTINFEVIQGLVVRGLAPSETRSTEIVEVPVAWEVTRLSDLLTIKHGFAFSSEFFRREGSDTILLTPGNFSTNKTLYFGPNTKFYAGPIPDGYVLRNGDLLVVMTDLTQDMAILGNAVRLHSDRRVLHNQRIGKVDLIDPARIDTEFARLLLNSKRVQSFVKTTASGTTVRHTSPSKILEIAVALPPLREQVEIAKIARDLEASCEQGSVADDRSFRSDALAQLTLSKSLIATDLLSGRVRVPT
jgi:type I restriction enzyme S subunit